MYMCIRMICCVCIQISELVHVQRDMTRSYVYSYDIVCVHSHEWTGWTGVRTKRHDPFMCVFIHVCFTCRFVRTPVHPFMCVSLMVYERTGVRTKRHDPLMCVFIRHLVYIEDASSRSHVTHRNKSRRVANTPVTYHAYEWVTSRRTYSNYKQKQKKWMESSTARR